MNSFSERTGISPAKMVQIGYMDKQLRNRLWNAIRYPWHTWSLDGRVDLYMLIWDEFFRRSADQIGSNENRRYQTIHDFYFNTQWNEAYDFVEYTCRTLMFRPTSLTLFAEPQVEELVGKINGVLESERSGYRYIGGNIVQITSPEEIDTVENALKSPDTVAAHMREALELFGNRENPDYRNAISEAISAVEAMCRLITGNEKATLGKALKELEKRGVVDVHPTLNEAFRKIYGYTSDAHGIRHAMSDLTSVDIEDAQFMIVACSTFVNYLKAKALRAGIALEEAPVEEVLSPN